MSDTNETLKMWRVIAYTWLDKEDFRKKWHVVGTLGDEKYLGK